MPSELLPVVRKDFRPLSGHGKSVGGGWPVTSDESGQKPGQKSGQRVSGILRDRKGENIRETSATPNCNSHPQSEFVNSWDRVRLNDQQVKRIDKAVGMRDSQRLEKETPFGSSLDWKPIKWIRSGSLSSRGSAFGHMSGCKIVGVDSFDKRVDTQEGNINLGDAAICVTPKTPDDDASRKKARLGWGEGLAKYEKKKVDPNDIVDKENGSINGMANGVSSSEHLHPSPSSLPDKGPTVDGNSGSASPTTSCSFACSLSPGLEEKNSITATTVDNDTCLPSVSLSQNHKDNDISHPQGLTLEENTSTMATTVNNDTCLPSVSLSQNNKDNAISHPQGLTFSLENFDLTKDFNLSVLLDELLQTDDTSAQGSGFAMNKLQLWKAGISRTLEITESEIDSLEHELKSNGDSCSFLPASISTSILDQCRNKNTEVSRNISSSVIVTRKADVGLDIRSEEAECSQDHVCMDGIQVTKGITCTVPTGDDVSYDRQNKVHESIYGLNKVLANRTSDELSKLLPTRHSCTIVVRATDDSEIKKKVAMRKRFLKFKERVTTLKFRTLQYSWKENLHLLSIRYGAKSQKKFESSSRMGYADHQKHRMSSYSRISSSVGSSRLVPTKEVVEYAKMLLSDSQVKAYRNVMKMPSLILDMKERKNSRFISSNGLVENPIDVEKERSIFKSWTVEDIEMFLDKYSLYGKNFRKIASFFQQKTVADCVEFYYKNHKSEFFQKTKKKSESAKEKSLNTSSMYLVTSGKRLNQETGATPLDMLGAASAMVANVDDIYCNKQETAAADVLAGICGSMSSEALGSCITSGAAFRRYLMEIDEADEETCSDDSCGEEINSSIWTDEERSSFVKAFRSYGKDFSMISRCMRTRSSEECKSFFSKAHKCLGLDVIDLGAGSEGTTGANGGGGGSDQDYACMVDSGSGISQDKSFMECKMEVEESDLREEQSMPEEKGINGNWEGAADSETANMEESVQNTSASDSASGAKVEESDTVSCVDLTTGNNLDLNAVSENLTCQETAESVGTMSNLFPQDPERKTLSRDDVVSRLTFRKSRSQSRIEPQSELKLDESLLLPRYDCLQMGTDLTSDAHQQKRSSSVDIEKPSKSGDVKLFGQIITNHSFTKANLSVVHDSEKKLDPPKSFGRENNNLQLKTSYGFWDGNRIQTGFSTLPRSAVLLAKYPAAFGNTSTLSKLDQKPHQQLRSSIESGKEYRNQFNTAPGFQTKKLINNNRAPSYHAYGQPITVDKLLPDVVGVNVVCNGVSDPVAAIRLHYAKTERYKNGGVESWRSNVSDIGSR